MYPERENNTTLAWRRYESGRTYNQRLIPNQYTTVSVNYDFFSGQQWNHMNNTPAMQRLAKPTFNIIKRVAQLFIASLTSSNTTINFEPLAYHDGENIKDEDSNAAVIATAEMRNLFEKYKLEYRIREALTDGAITGDYCAHFYWDPEALPYGGAFSANKGEIQMELVDGINVMFGNPNITDVQKQPYIILVGRAPVKELQEEANQFKKSRTKRGGLADDQIAIDAMQPDSEWQYQTGIGGKIELIEADSKDGKALYLYMYTKVKEEEPVLDEETGLPIRVPKLDDNGDRIEVKLPDGTPVLDMNGMPTYEMEDAKRLVTHIHCTKATRNVIIFEDVDTGLSLYPIAWANWEKRKNSYHGTSLVSGIIPNQIFINSMWAMIFRHLQLQSFPKEIYNADLIPQWTNEIGKPLAVHNMAPGQDLRSVATVLQPADMSNQIILGINTVMSQTKDMLGATDAQLGNVRADNTSALMVLQSAAEVPLENIRAGLHEWVEDIGRINLDMMGTYYGERPVLIERTFRDLTAGAGGGAMIDPTTGQMIESTTTKRVVEMFDFSQLKNLWLNLRVETGATTYYSEIAMTQTLDNLRREGMLEIIDYLERIPDKLIPRKAELIEDLKKRQAQAQEAPQQAQQSNLPPNQGLASMGGDLDPERALANLPNAIQAKYASLPQSAQKALGNIAVSKSVPQS